MVKGDKCALAKESAIIAMPRMVHFFFLIPNNTDTTAITMSLLSVQFLPFIKNHVSQAICSTLRSVLTTANLVPRMFIANKYFNFLCLKCLK